MDNIKVLFLASNPQGSPLQLDNEAREITSKIRASEFRDSMDFITRWAVRPDDLQQTLLEVKPHILHFSGHGTTSDEIVLMDDQGNEKPVSKEALQHLLSVLKDNIQLVVLNACYSRPQGEAIAECIDCAVGMNQAIGDKAAILFAGSFYRALGFGRSIKEAFELGRNALLLESVAEENTPELLHRKGVDPAKLSLIGPQASKTVSEKPLSASGSSTPGKPIRLFYSYSHSDELFREKLETHLSLLRRQGVISEWHDRKIGAGTEWEQKIDENLNSAEVILLLVSADFLASDYCFDTETKVAMERHDAGEARVLPIILRPCDWQSAPFGKLQALPKDATAVTKWSDEDEAFTDIARGIRRAAEHLSKRP